MRTAVSSISRTFPNAPSPAGRGGPHARAARMMSVGASYSYPHGPWRHPRGASHGPSAAGASAVHGRADASSGLGRPSWARRARQRPREKPAVGVDEAPGLLVAAAHADARRGHDARRRRDRRAAPSAWQDREGRLPDGQTVLIAADAQRLREARGAAAEQALG